MRAFVLLLAVVPLGSLAAQRDTTAVECYSVRAGENRAAERLLWNGFRVRVAYAAEDAGGAECRVTLVAPAGDTVLSYVGFNAAVAGETGTDLDNDGSPDLLLMVDEGGGNRCCARYHAVSFAGTPRVAWTLGPQAFEIDRTPSGTVVRVWHASYDLGPSMADAPVFQQVVRPSAGRLEDVTLRFCDELVHRDSAFSRQAWEVLTPVRQARLRADGPVHGDFESLEAHAAAYALLLQIAYCGRTDEADRFLAATWPERLHTSVRATVLRVVTSVSVEAGERLRGWGGAAPGDSR
jgi:hypothetical protein